MGEVKEFINKSQLDFVSIARGEEEINEDNFSFAYKMLNDVDAFDLERNSIGRDLLESLKYVESNFIYYRAEESRFIDNPESFSMKLIPGSTIDKSLSTVKSIQHRINLLFGNYNVSMYLLSFLILSTRELERKNYFLTKNYNDILDRLHEV